MITDRIVNGSSDVIMAQMESGLGDVLVNVRRRSDGFYLDWSDSTFKASGWITKDSTDMTEVGTTGQYEMALALGIIMNLTPDDVYVVTVHSATSDFSPQVGELKAGDWVSTIGSRASQASVDGVPATVASQLASAHGAGSWEGSSASAVADAVDTKLSTNHGVGSWEGASAAATAAAVWNEAASGHLSAGTFGFLLQSILGLVQHNFRVKDQVYWTENLLTSAKIAIYPTKEDCEFDRNPLKQYQINVGYNLDGQVTSYKVVEI